MPFMCMICGNPYVGYKCIYCVKENEMKNKANRYKGCKKIQWTPVCLDQEDNIVCPECGGPAEMILGVFANPCYAHTIPSKTKEN